MAQFIGYGSGKNGSIASASGVINTVAFATATAGDVTVTTSLTVVIGDMVVLHQATGSNHGKWEVVQVASVGSGSFATTRPLDNTYASPDGQAVLVPQYTGGSLTNTLTPRVRQDVKNGGILTFAVNGNLTFSGGTLNATSIGQSFLGTYTVYGFAGATGVNGRNPDNRGAGYTSDEWIGQQGANGNGGGGGNGGGTGGGGGGNATAGTTTSGTGGGTAGNSTLTLIDFGGGGGSPGGDSDQTGHGGNGGGIIIVFARSINGSGSILANASNGSKSGTSSGGGGGGAGGSILLKGQNVDLSGITYSAAGGFGGGNGGNGGAGWIHVDYAYSYNLTTSSTTTVANDPTLGDGGAGIFALL